MENLVENPHKITAKLKWHRHKANSVKSKHMVNLTVGKGKRIPKRLIKL